MNSPKHVLSRELVLVAGCRAEGFVGPLVFPGRQCESVSVNFWGGKRTVPSFGTSHLSRLYAHCRNNPVCNVLPSVRASDLVGGGYSTVSGEMSSVSVLDPTLCDIH